MAPEQNGNPLAPLFQPAALLKPFFAAPTAFYASICKETLNASSRRLQAQADYLKRLSECSGPGEMLACYGDFVQRSIAGSVEDGRRVEDAFRAALTPAAAAEQPNPT